MKSEMTTMNWAALLSKKRYVPSTEDPPDAELKTSRVTVFQEDAGRIIHSTPFRRLQGKTQVHPFPSFDYLRTRLTHTVEVAHVGRVIATGAMKALFPENTLLTGAGGSTETPDDKPQPGTLAATAGDIVYAACLAHDLGNPPFGHIGEHAIQTWFARLKEQDRFAPLFDDARFLDFLNFDGNAQGFRILTRLTGWRGKGGLRLSYATLGAFSKYPFSSQKINGSKKKFGFMDQDKSAAGKVYKGLGLIPEARGDGTSGPFPPPDYCRHPLAYIVEAADDICYLTTDIEDAGRMKLLSFAECEKLLRAIADTGNHLPHYAKIPKDKEQDRLKYLRAAAASELIDAAIERFCEVQEDLLRGGFRQNLLESTSFAPDIKAIRDACEMTIYNEPKKLQLEAAGFAIIMRIMDLFGYMLLELVQNGENALDMRERGLYQLLPDENREMLRGADPYRAMIVLVDYISGMSDRYIRDLFQKLTGSNPSIGRMM